MLVSDVLTAASVRRLLLMGLAGLGVAVLLVAVAFISIRMRQTYLLESKLASLESAHNDLVLTCGASRGEQNLRIDAMERLLFGDVLPQVEQNKKSATVPKMRIEQVFLENQALLRKRVEALERWRLAMIE